MTRTPHLLARRLAALALTAATALGAAACGDASEPTEAPEAPAGQIIDITISGARVDPNGERVEAGVGQVLTLRVTADQPGEIHVHSTPEQELTYGAGTTDLPLTIDQPGLVAVEAHDLDLVIVQLEVR